MIKFIRNYFKMKAQEIQMKLTFYSHINKLIENNKEIISMIVDLFGKFKGTPIDELQDKFIEAMAEIIHKSGIMNEEPENADE